MGLNCQAATIKIIVARHGSFTKEGLRVIQVIGTSGTL